MSALAKQELHYTLEEYLTLETNAVTRYEYFAGEIFDMAGGTLKHSFLSGNVYHALEQKLTGTQCRALNSEMRIKVPQAPPYRYPDASVVCGGIQTELLGALELLLNPILLVEVLSESTEKYDREGKFLAYQSIESFQEYLLIEQDRYHVTQYVKQGDGAWLRRDFIGIETEVKLSSVDCTLTLAEIYRDVVIT